jgi:hypothetical protein
MKKHVINYRKKSVAIVLGIVIVGFLVNCDKLRRFNLDDVPDCNKPITTIAPQQIEKWYLSFYGIGMPQQNFVIKTSTEWNTLLNSMDSVEDGWKQLFSNTSINFSTHQVLVLFDEVRNGSQWYIEVADIKEHCFHIVVTYHIWKIVGNSNLIPTQAFHFVKIPVSNKPVVFQQEFDNEVANVSYAICPPPYWTNSSDTMYLRGTAYLFIDSIPAGQLNKNHIMNIVYHTAQDSTCFYAHYPFNGQYSFLYYPWRMGVDYYEGIVCNFPDFAKNWNVQPEGKQLYYQGEFYWYSGTHFSQYGCLVLTTLNENAL